MTITDVLAKIDPATFTEADGEIDGLNYRLKLTDKATPAGGMVGEWQDYAERNIQALRKLKETHSLATIDGEITIQHLGKSYRLLMTVSTPEAPKAEHLAAKYARKK